MIARIRAFNWCKVLAHRVVQLELDNDRDVICTRCGSHGYWNQDEWQLDWFWWHLRLWWLLGEWIRDLHSRFIYWRYTHLGRNQSIKAKTDVDDDDIPF